MLSEQDQLETWWESLSADQQDAVLEADLDDIPGWIIASVVAAHVEIATDPETGAVEDLKSRAPQALERFIAGKRGD
jgi:hypothetical protein